MRAVREHGSLLGLGGHRNLSPRPIIHNRKIPDVIIEDFLSFFFYLESDSFGVDCDSVGTRTRNLLLRRQLLYPVELRNQPIATSISKLRRKGNEKFRV